MGTPRKFSFSIRGLCVAVLLLSFALHTWKLTGDLSTARSQIERLENLLYENQTIQIEYGRFLVVEVASQLYGLRLTQTATRDVNYEWYKLSGEFIDGIDNARSHIDFLKERSEWASGTTNEVQGRWKIPVGPITIPWSSGGIAWGWLYLSEIEAPIRIYGRQLEESDLVKLQYLDDDVWIYSKSRTATSAP